jgi:hypothetical protein
MLPPSPLTPSSSDGEAAQAVAAPVVAAFQLDVAALLPPAGPAAKRHRGEPIGLPP